MTRNLGLNGIVYFEAAARQGRVSKAAEELDVSKSAVSQQIKLLEQRLGVLLFRREKRILHLTQEGERLFGTASIALKMLRETLETVARQRASRQLTLRVSPSFAALWLTPRLGEFVRDNPQWNLRIDAAPDPSDFEREVIDLEIRYGDGEWPYPYVKLVGRDYVLPLVSPTHLEELLTENADLETIFRSTRLIDSVKTMIRWDAWLVRNGFHVDNTNSLVQIDRSAMSIQLAVQGTGIALESLTLAYDELARGTLVPVSPLIPVIETPAYWIVGPSRLQSRRINQLFTSWLCSKLDDHDRDIRSLIHDLKLKTTSADT